MSKSEVMGQIVNTAGTGIIEQVFDKTAVLSFIYPLGVLCLLLPAFAGVSIGMGKAAHGISQAAAIKNEILLTILPAGFIGVTVLYAGLIFFLGKKTEVPKDFNAALPWLAGQIVTGVGLFWAAVGLGDISSVATITTAQQKRFKSSFILLLVFGEFIGLFSLIIGVLLTTGADSWK
ncbi:V-type H+-transporting ATPase 16kDa proteolipid subunit [Nematocida sp. AWRm80]|nr:V-type H+-transporting ATPase 16kDa proteolipid subunit [Nematocida sp. AWRm80]